MISIGGTNEGSEEERRRPPPGEPLILRTMTAADVPRVSQIDKRAFGDEGWPATSFIDELNGNRLARYFVLDPGQNLPLVGYLGCWALVDELHIVTVAVDPTYQRRGLGEALILHALDLAHDIGAEQVTLECRESNQAALALYRKYRFQEVGRRERYYTANQEDALILTVPDARQPQYRDLLEGLRSAHQARYSLAITPEAR